MLSFFQRLKRPAEEMTVGEAQGPVRKRPRLSLKSTKNRQDQSIGEAEQLVEEQSIDSPLTGDGAPNSKVSEVKQEREDLVCLEPIPENTEEYGKQQGTEEKDIPKVAGLQNLGNTCFLNSVLQVLRYTPGFSQQLSTLFKELTAIEKKLAVDAKATEGESTAGDLLPWKLVRSLHKLFNRMDRLEEKCMNSDTDSLSTRPERLLDIVRDLNPMFEGNLQHDAHEVLRCMLAYIEDATSEVNKLKVKVQPAAAALPDNKQPTLMNFFKTKAAKQDLVSAEGMELKDVDLAGSRSLQSPQTNGPQEFSPTRPAVELKVPHTPKHSSPSIKIYTAEDIIEHVSGGKKLSTKYPTMKNEVTPVKKEWDKAKVTDTDSKVSPSPKGRKKLSLEDALEEITGEHAGTIQNGKDNGQKSNDDNINDNNNNSSSLLLDHKAPFTNGEIAPKISKKGRPRKQKTTVSLTAQMEKGVPAKRQCRNKNTSSKPISQEKDSESSKEENGHVVTEFVSQPLKANCKQPSITSMFAKKRLGMRGAVIRRDPSPHGEGLKVNSCSPTPIKEQDCGSDSPKEPHGLSEDRKLNSEAFVKLTNTPISYSPKKIHPESSENGLKGKRLDNKLLSGAFVKIERSPCLESPKKKNQSAEFMPSPSKNYLQGDTKVITQFEKSQDVKLAPGSPHVKLNRNAIENYCSPKKENMDSGAASVNELRKQEKEKVENIKADLFGALRGKKKNGSRNSSNFKLQNGDAYSKSGRNTKKSNEVEKSSASKEQMLDHLTITNKNKSDKVEEWYQNIGAGDSKKAILSSENLCSQGVGKGFGGKKTDDLMIVKVVDGCTGQGEDDTDIEDKMDANRPDTYMASPAKSPRSRKKKTDELDCLVQDLFQGTMALRTRCLECEGFTQRKEDFQDIGVPVKKEKVKKEEGETDEDSDDESCKPGSISWLMEAFSEIERLQDENKYFCEKCHRYVEAERSTQYVTLPQILMLHLKRFEANSGLFGSISKVNDFMATPMVLPCFSNRCRQPCRKHTHEFELYAVVMHTGISISSGHYVAYIKAPPVQKLKDPSKKHETKSAERQRPVSQRIKRKIEEVTSQNNTTCNIYSQNGVEIPDYSGNWFECDDDRICLKGHEEMQSLLNNHASICETPYLLFYKMTPVPYERVVLV